MIDNPNITNEQLMQIANKGQASPQQQSLVDNPSISDEQLRRLAEQTPNNVSARLVQDITQSPNFEYSQKTDRSMIPFSKESLAMAGRTAGAFNAGIESIPKKVSYNVDSTINSIAHGLGIVDTREYNARQKKYDQDLLDSMHKGGTVGFGGREEDLAAHPTLANVTRDVGALGTEILGGMGAAKAVGTGLAKALPAAANYMQGAGILPGAARVASGVASDMAQGALVSGLEARDNKGEAALAGGAITGAISAPLRTAGELLGSFIRGGKSVDDMASKVKDNTQAERSILGTNNATLGQVTGNSTLQSLEQRARSAMIYGTDGPINREMDQVGNYLTNQISNYGTSVSKATGYKDDAARIMEAFDRTAAGLRDTKNNLYTNAINSLDEVNEGGITTEGTINTIKDIQSRLGSDPKLQMLRGPDKTFLNETLESAKVVGGRPSKAEDIYDMAQQIGEDIDRYMKNPKGSSKKVVDELKGLRASLFDDLEAAAYNSGIPGKFDEAKSFYRDVYKPIDDLGLQSGDSFNQTKQLLRYLGDSRQANRESILKSLGPEVQGNLKGFVANEAIMKSRYKDGTLNPQLFMKNFSDSVKQNGLVFNKQDQQMAEGLSKLNSIIANVPRNAPQGSNLGLESVWVRFLTTNPLGRNIALKAAKLPADSPGMQSIVNGMQNIVSMVGKGAVATTAAQTMQSPTTSESPDQTQFNNMLNISTTGPQG